jgi:hypothetical protein
VLGDDHRHADGRAQQERQVTGEPGAVGVDDIERPVAAGKPPALEKPSQV